MPRDCPSRDQCSRLSRRSFVHHGGMLAGGMILGSQTATAGASADDSSANTELPRRVLGKTNVPITTLSIGTAASRP